MSLQFIYSAVCARCGATKQAAGGAFANTQWRKTDGLGGVLAAEAWLDPYGEDCICPECHAKYLKLKAARDKADEEMRAAAGKFTPAPSEQGGSGTESDPYEFAENTDCVVNAFYAHDGTLYVYMPADAESHSYASWADAEADFAAWEVA